MPPPPPLLPTPGVSVDVVCSMPFIGTVHPQLRLDWGDANRNVEGGSLGRYHGQFGQYHGQFGHQIRLPQCPL